MTIEKADAQDIRLFQLYVHCEIDNPSTDNTVIKIFDCIHLYRRDSEIDDRDGDTPARCDWQIDKQLVIAKGFCTRLGSSSIMLSTL